MGIALEQAISVVRERGLAGSHAEETMEISMHARRCGNPRMHAAVIAVVVMVLSFCGLDTVRAADLQAGKRTYESVCAACHGPSGRLPDDSPIRAAFDPPPADFTDPLFNSREPASDWQMVVRHGGHAMGLSAQMPAQGQALSETDIRNVVAYVKTLADTSRYPPGEMNFFLPIRTKKAFPEDEVVWKGRYTARDGRDVARNVLEIEKRVGTRGQWLLEAVHEDDGVNSEITEVELGYKHVLAWSATKRSILSGALVVALPTGGNGNEEFVPYLAYGRQWSERWVMQGSARAIVPFADPDTGELELAGIVHYRWTPWPRRVFGGLEFTATTPFQDSGGDRVQVTVLPQMRIGLTRGGHVALNVGVELPLSDQDYDYRLHLNLLWDFADGGFFKGW